MTLFHPPGSSTCYRHPLHNLPCVMCMTEAPASVNAGATPVEQGAPESAPNTLSSSSSLSPDGVEALLREFVGFLSADVPELHAVEVPRLAESLDRFLAASSLRPSQEPPA